MDTPQSVCAKARDGHTAAAYENPNSPTANALASLLLCRRAARSPWSGQDDLVIDVTSALRSTA